MLAQSYFTQRPVGPKGFPMPAAALAKLKRAIEELEKTIAVNRYSDADRIGLKSELENHIQRIDELRQRL